MELMATTNEQIDTFTHNMKLVSIIIVSYNKSKQLEDTLQSIHENLNQIDYELIVIDNASSDNNLGMIRNKFSTVKLLVNKENLGFAKACNQGAKFANSKYLLFVNSDIILKDNPVIGMLNLYSNEDNVGIVSAQLINKDGSLQPSHYSFPTLLKRFFELVGLKKIILLLKNHFIPARRYSYEIQSGKGAFLMIPKIIFDKVGGFDENYFMYIEDVDLSLRVRRLGYKNMLFYSTSIIHLGWNIENINDPFGFFHRNKGLIHLYAKNYKKASYITFVWINLVFLYAKYFIFFLKRNKNPHLIKTLIRVIKMYKNHLIGP
jgi:GT2 family glycosyltransferase